MSIPIPADAIWFNQCPSHFSMTYEQVVGPKWNFLFMHLDDLLVVSQSLDDHFTHYICIEPTGRSMIEAEAREMLFFPDNYRVSWTYSVTRWSQAQ